MPLGEARRRCPRLIVVDGSFGDYVGLSDRVFDICRSYTPLVEQISIDEAFLDVSGAIHLFGAPATIAARIRRDVQSQLGLAISAGVARTKFLAKIGSRVAKPDGLVVIDPATELEFLHALPVELIWGVGPVTAARLADLGICHGRRTRPDLRGKPVGAARPWCRSVTCMPWRGTEIPDR